MKINLTKRAQEELKKVIDPKDTGRPLRIFIMAFGWGGPSFGLALDELKKGDVKVEVGEFTFILEKKLVDNFRTFTIDYNDNWLRKGFKVTPDRVSSSC